MTSFASTASRASDGLSTPPAGDLLRIVPLGGLGEIGMNCMALEQEDGILVVDCGITFPHDDTGVDVYHPDFSYLTERASRVCGIVLTHGHEDHVGALPYLLDKLKVPVFGPAHALAIGRHRLSDRGFDPGAFDLRTVRPRTTYRLGPFEVEPVRVTHSISEAAGLAIRTRAGIVFHTGDFRFDPDPPDGELTDQERLAELGRSGVRLMMSDSTCVDVRGPHESEASVGRALEKLITGASHRVVIAMFASNMQRLKMLGDLAVRARRKVALFGRSIGLSVQLGHELGSLSWPSDLVVAQNDAARVAPERLLVVAGGTQAEPGSALMRLSGATYRPRFERLEKLYDALSSDSFSGRTLLGCRIGKAAKGNAEFGPATLEIRQEEPRKGRARGLKSVIVGKGKLPKKGRIMAVSYNS